MTKRRGFHVGVRFLALLLVTVFLLSTSIGCTNKAGKDSSSALSGPITATYMSSGTYDVAAQEVAAAFQQKTGVEVRIVAFPWMTLVQNDNMDVLTQAGQYDVHSTQEPKLFRYYVPLGDLIARDKADQGIIEGLWQAVPTVDGVPLGVPYAADSYGMIYRTDLFQQAGVTPPATWDDFDAVLEQLGTKLAGTGIAPFVLAGGQPDQLGAFFMGRYDGYFFTAKGELKLEPEKAAAALERLKAEFKFCPSNVQGLSIDEGNAVFFDGKAAIMECWPSFTRAGADDPTKSKIVGKWAFMPYPAPGLDYLSLWSLAISKQSKYQDTAWEWIKAYVNEANSKVFFEKYGIGPVYSSVYNDQALAQKYGNDFPATLANLERAARPPLPSEAEAFLGQTVSDFLAGQQTAAQAVEAINSKWASLGIQPEMFELAKAEKLVEGMK